MGDSARSESFQFLKDGYLHVSVRKRCLSIALCLEEGSYSRIQQSFLLWWVYILNVLPDGYDWVHAVTTLSANHGVW